jgi:hypothetical protein
MTERKLDPVTEELQDRVKLLANETKELRVLLNLSNEAVKLALFALDAHLARVERELREVKNAPRPRS